MNNTLYATQLYKGFKIVAGPGVEDMKTHLPTVSVTIFAVNAASPTDTYPVYTICVTGTEETPATSVHAVQDAQMFIDTEYEWEVFMHRVGEDVLELREGRDWNSFSNDFRTTRKLPTRVFFTEDQRAEYVKKVVQMNVIRQSRRAAQEKQSELNKYGW